MISKKSTRKGLARALLKVDPKKQIKWPIAEFRHAVFNTVDLCRGIKSSAWKVERKKQRIYCTLFFNTCSVSISYDVNYKSVFIQKIESRIQYGKKVPVVTAVKKTDCTGLPSAVKEWQPKSLIVVRKKNA